MYNVLKMNKMNGQAYHRNAMTTTNLNTEEVDYVVFSSWTR
jgi:hypothetical protein